jgi:hypothetical protein
MFGHIINLKLYLIVFEQHLTVFNYNFDFRNCKQQFNHL